MGLGARPGHGREHHDQPAAAGAAAGRGVPRRRRAARQLAVGAGVPAVPGARARDRRRPRRAARAGGAQGRDGRAAAAAGRDDAVVGGGDPARRHRVPRGPARRGGARPAAGRAGRVHRRGQRAGEPEAAAAGLPRRAGRDRHRGGDLGDGRAAAGRERPARDQGPAPARRHLARPAVGAPGRAPGAAGHPRPLAPAGLGDGLARLRPPHRPVPRRPPDHRRPDPRRPARRLPRPLRPARQHLAGLARRPGPAARARPGRRGAVARRPGRPPHRLPARPVGAAGVDDGRVRSRRRGLPARAGAARPAGDDDARCSRSAHPRCRCSPSPGSWSPRSPPCSRPTPPPAPSRGAAARRPARPAQVAS